eukprot:19608-Pleurochrysis_carterae.AAC.2
MRAPRVAAAPVSTVFIPLQSSGIGTHHGGYLYRDTSSTSAMSSFWWYATTGEKCPKCCREFMGAPSKLAITCMPGRERTLTMSFRSAASPSMSDACRASPCIPATHEMALAAWERVHGAVQNSATQGIEVNKSCVQ